MPIPKSSNATDRQLLRDTVRQTIQDAILDGTLEPGERLHDDQLISWLGVSRTPIREALGDLARAGLVETSANRYTRVAVPDPARVSDTIQTLGVLYGGAVRLAVSRMDEATKKRVVASVGHCLDDLEAGDGPGLNRHALVVFDAFVDHCGNPSLQKVCHDVTDGLAYKLRLPNIVELINWSEMAGQFEALRKATIAGDPVAAELATEAIHQLPGVKFHRMDTLNGTSSAQI